jgi:hypothetical protein
MEKKTYCAPEIEITTFNSEIVLTTFSVDGSGSGISGGVGAKGKDDEDPSFWGEDFSKENANVYGE